MVVDPAALRGADGPVAARVVGLARLLRGARERLDAGATAGGGALGALGRHLLARTGCGARSRPAARAPGWPTATSTPSVRLFETAARAEDQRGYTTVANFLDTLAAQQIPADTLADRGVRGDAVRLLTAHRSKGLEWRLVVVAHVQEDGWPDLRRRGTLLQADRIGSDGLLPPLSLREALIEERRLFYVACTRARQRLVVTAVASQDDDGEQPSRFLAELGVHERHLQGRPARPLSMAGLVAELRRTVADPDQPEPLRAAAAQRLARLADERIAERPVVPQADPATWWGTRAATASDEPLRPADRPITLSASALTSLLACPARGSSSARPAAPPPRPPPRASGSWCTRSPSGSPRASSPTTPPRSTS